MKWLPPPKNIEDGDLEIRPHGAWQHRMAIYFEEDFECSSFTQKKHCIILNDEAMVLSEILQRFECGKLHIREGGDLYGEPNDVWTWYVHGDQPSMKVAGEWVTVV